MSKSSFSYCHTAASFENRFPGAVNLIYVLVLRGWNTLGIFSAICYKGNNILASFCFTAHHAPFVGAKYFLLD